MHPLAKIYRMVPDPLHVFCDHQNIQFAAGVVGIFYDFFHQFRLHFFKQAVYLIVRGDDFGCQFIVFSNERIDTVIDHL